MNELPAAFSCPMRTPSCSPPRKSSVNIRILRTTSSSAIGSLWLFTTGLAGKALRPIHSVSKPSGTLMANSQGQLATDKMPAATVGPAMEDVATTSELIAMPRPSMARG